MSNILNLRIVSICPQVFGNVDPVRHRLHRIYMPLSSQTVNVYETPIHILWATKAPLSAIDTSVGWLPDRVVPVLPTVSSDVNHLYSRFYNPHFYSGANQRHRICPI